jgi:plasmid stabilization system protein ParE
MARVLITDNAAAELGELVRSHSLPPDTRGRVSRSLRPLAEFPEIGPKLSGSLTGRRFVLGPWRWMIIVYRHYPDRNLVAVLAIVDGRLSDSPAANR